MNDPATSSSARSCSEKSLRRLRRERLHVHRRARRQQDRDPQAVEAIFSMKVTKVNTMNRKGKRKRNRRTGDFGQARPTSKRAIVTARRRRLASTSSGADDAHSQAQAHQPRPPVPDRLRLRRDHARTKPEKSLTKPKPKHRWSQLYGRMTSRHRGGGHKQRYRVDRLQAQQGRRAGQGRGDRVRPEPQRPHRAAALPRRREALHPRPARRRASATCCRAARAPRSAPATRCRCATSRSARPCTTSSSSRARGGKMGRGAGAAIQLIAKEGDVRHAAASVHRDAPRADRLPRHRRRGRQQRGRAHLDRQGRAATAGRASARTRAVSR